MRKVGTFSLKRIGAALRAHLVAGLVAVSTAILMTWPLAKDAGQVVLRAIYFWDAYTNAMIMGSRVDAVLGRAALSLYDDYYFAPLPRSIVFNENHFGLSLLFAPFYLLSDNPLWAYNITLLISLALSVFFMYLLVRRLTGSAYAGIIAGVAYAYSPFVFFEMGRIQLMAVQWIPAAFLFLHRAIEGQRPGDIIAFWLCILLQIGTCLYFTMFLIPLLAVGGAVLLVRHRPGSRFYYWFGALTVVASSIALLIAYPYFAVRESFNLERSLAVASANDGKFSFFANVHPTNLTLTGMHHLVKSGHAHDEIAFPGFTALTLFLTALLVPAVHRLARGDRKQLLLSTLSWFVLGALATVVTLITHSMLPGVLLFGAGCWLLISRGASHPFHGTQGLYIAVLLTALVMFVGIFPFTWQGTPVRGVYYYFHTYFPGFNGIRKVGRQAAMTTFVVCVLAGFGGAWVFSRIRERWGQLVCVAFILTGLTYELRCFPHPVERVWGADQLPAALTFVASLPEKDLIALVPQDKGRNIFRADIGMALHNFLALYHKHRFVNGQSSWQPPVTELARRAVDRLPDDGARRALIAIGTRHLVVFGEDLRPEQMNLKTQLAARPSEYQLIFEQGAHSVFTLLDNNDQTLDLLPTPKLPAFAQQVPQRELRPTSNLRPERVGYAVDGDPLSYWTGGRNQGRGQYFEIKLNSPRKIVALEIEAPTRVMDLPVSFRLSASKGSEDLKTVLQEPRLRFYREQVFTPKTFVFRLLLPRPTEADQLRITVEQPVPGLYFSIHELRVYESAN